MAKCEICGNYYDKSFEVTIAGKVHTFDCLQCAIHSLAPACASCGCHVIGHGVEREGKIYCSDHCAHHVVTPPVDEQEGVVEKENREEPPE